MTVVKSTLVVYVTFLLKKDVTFALRETHNLAETKDGSANKKSGTIGLGA